jgi:hypothetical protein
MGEAKKRGTLDQRIKTAEPKKPKMSAAERHRRLYQAAAEGAARIIIGGIADVSRKLK